MALRWILLLAVFAVLALAGTLSYYIDALWFQSLGYGDVFWRSLSLQGTVFTTFFAATFFLLYGAFIALKPPRPLPCLIVQTTVLIPAAFRPGIRAHSFPLTSVTTMVGGASSGRFR